MIMDMKNLRVGDKVRVISEEEVKKHSMIGSDYKFDYNYNFTPSMFEFCDKIVTIKSTIVNDAYHIKESKEDNWYFSPDMFEPIEANDQNSLVSHPKHYQLKNGLEVIQVVEAFTDGLNGIDAVDIGNAVKYLGRLGKKDDTIQDAEKAAWYLNHFIERNKVK